MLYDLSNPLQAESFKVKAESLGKKGGIVELTEKKPQRSLQANKYLHVIIAYFALQVGETAEYVKKHYYKILCNKDIYIREVDDKYLGKIKILRSSADLDSEEFSLTITRFRNWSAGEGIYLPSAEEHMFIQQMEIELSRNKQYL
jgi:hypothetical protein